MRARHRHRGEQGAHHPAGSSGVHSLPHNVIRTGEGAAPKLHAGKRARGGAVAKRIAGGAVHNPENDRGYLLRPENWKYKDLKDEEKEMEKALDEEGGDVEEVVPMSRREAARGGGIHIKKSHKGLLHKNLGVAADKPIPAKKLSKALHSSDPAVKKRAVFAENAKHWHH
jgi:hypothetical protein